MAPRKIGQAQLKSRIGQAQVLDVGLYRSSQQAVVALLVQQTSQETRFSRDMYVRFGAISQCVVRCCQQGGVANRIVTLKCALHRCLTLIYFRWPIPLCPMANNRATKRDPMLRHEMSMRLQRLLCMFQTSIAKGRAR